MQSATSIINTWHANRDLLLSWTSRTIRARYQQSVLGGLWAILQPAASAAIFTIIFTLVVPINTGEIPYIVFSFSGMVVWVFFSATTAEMIDSLVNNMNLITKIYFPREVLPIATMLARLMDFCISFFVLVGLMVFFGVPFFTIALLWLPVILAVEMALIAGLGLAGAALNVFYRDMRHLIVLGLQLLLYATPIIYPVTSVPEWLRPFYFLNPMAGIVVAFRSILLEQRAPGSYFAISGVVAFAIFLLGYWFFKSKEHRFADVI